MCVYVGIDDLAANALIELMEKDVNRVTFSQLEKYGMAVVDSLNAENEEAVLIFSRESTNAFIHDYSDYYDIVKENEDTVISLKEGISVNDLKFAFRSYLSVDMLIAFVSKSSLSALGI